MENIVLIARWYELLGVAALGMGIYFSILFLLREVKREDLALFMDTLNVKKMLGYIKDEMKGK